MFRPHIQKTRVLGYLAIINMFLVYWALNSYTETRTFGYGIKKKSERYMNNQINFLRDLYNESLINSGKDSFSYADFLIGPRDSEIKTTKGSKLSKQITLSPRFSAMITQYRFNKFCCHLLYGLISRCKYSGFICIRSYAY